MKNAAFFVLAAMLVLLTACTSAPYADRSKPLDDPATLQAAGGVEAFKLLPLVASESSYLPTLTDDLEEGKRVWCRLEQSGETWKWTLKDLRVIHYKATPAGIVIVREDDLDEDVAVSYDPAIPALPTLLEQGKPVKGTSNMLVRDIESGALKNKGKCEYTIELLGRHNIWTPRGVVDAVVIRDSRKITLKFVTVDVAITTAFSAAPLGKSSPGKGVSMGQVGEHVHQVIKPLGLFEDESTEELRLAPDVGTAVFNPKPRRNPKRASTQPSTTQPSATPASQPAAGPMKK